MLTYIARRLIGAVVVIVLAGTVVFAILQIAGDPASLLLSSGGSKSDLERMRAELGLDQPLPVRYGRFLLGVVTLDMGNSYRYGESAFSLVFERLPLTLELALAALGIAVLVGVPLGVLAAAREDSIADIASSFFAFLGQAAPNFWLGAMFILLFSVQFRWLPTSGAGGLEHLVLPAATLALRPLAQLTRLTRSEVLETLCQEYVRTAYAKGLRPRSVLWRHVLRNAAIPIVTLIGLDLGALLGGAIVIESVFAWPGSGRLLLQAIEHRDLPVIQAAVVVLASTFVMINLAVDLLYTRLDPRVRLS